MPADRILDVDEVAQVEVVIDGLSNEHPIAWEDRRRLDELVVSHEALREQNTGLGVRVQEAWHRTEQAEEALAAMTAVARRYRDGCGIASDPDEPFSMWTQTFVAADNEQAIRLEAITDAERRALVDLEATFPAHRCRWTDMGERCPNQSAVKLQRGTGTGHDRCYHYCEHHMYGRVLHDGAVWSLRALPTKGEDQ